MTDPHLRDQPRPRGAAEQRSNGDVVVRAAVPEDAADLALAQLLSWRRAYPGILDPDYLAALDLERLGRDWRRALRVRRPSVFRLVLCVDGAAVGWAGFGAPRDAVPAGTGELHAINLHPDYWSRGLGSLLFRQSVATLAQLGYGRGYLWVAHGNRRASRFYERHGWSDDGAVKDDARFRPPLLEHRFSADLSLSGPAGTTATGPPWPSST